MPHKVNQMFQSQSLFGVLFLSYLISLFFYGVFEGGLFKYKWGKDGNKLAMLLELFCITKLNVTFTRNTH